jgi:phage anti-repressor protein
MSNQELIPVFAGEISGVSAQLVDARSLHKFLESERQFSNWITYQIDAFGFEQGIDFIKINNFVNGKNSKPLIDYHLSLDMAKELSMVERNAKGREARRYFIECERRLLTGLPEFLKPITEPITWEDFNWRKQILSDAFENLEKAHVLMMITVSGKELLAGKCFE